MTLRLGHKKRPPFLFSQRARVNQLVCDPRPYVRAWASDGRPLWAPCLAWSPGPVELASTGDGSYQTLYGENWLAQICVDGTWVLYKRLSNELLEVVPWDVVPPTVSITARHPTLCFDQAARPAIAWEDDSGVRLREFNETTGAYHFIGPFPGVDPVLLSDAQVNRWVPGSDVVLYYLSSDRTKVMYRIQAENFATEHEHYTFDDPVVLDAVDTGRYRYQLKVGDEHGGVFGTLTDFDALVSDLYPVYAGELVGVSAASQPGDYARGAWSYQQPEALNVAGVALGGAYEATVIHFALAEAALLASGASQAGEYVLAAFRHQQVAEVEVSAAVLAGEYAQAAIRSDAAEEPLLVTASALEGAYVPA